MHADTPVRQKMGDHRAILDVPGDQEITSQLNVLTFKLSIRRQGCALTPLRHGFALGENPVRVEALALQVLREIQSTLFQISALFFCKLSTQGKLQPRKRHQRFKLLLGQIPVWVIKLLSIRIGQHGPVDFHRRLRQGALRENT